MEIRTHSVEGTDPRLFAEVIHPGSGPSATRPVLLLHGFASSSRLNWHESGWVNALTTSGRSVITVDLPGHGRSATPSDLDSFRPSRIRADLLQLLVDAGVHPLDDDNPETGVDIIGYSLGARLAWDFGATQPELVRRMVLGGGPGTGDPLATFDLPAARGSLAGTGEALPAGTTGELMRMAASAPGNDPQVLLNMVEAVQDEPFVPGEAVPAIPLLLVAGDLDPFAAGNEELAELSGQSELLWLPGRTHVDAVTSRAFKQAAVAFLG